MYGLGIPILFPIAVFSFLVLFLVEKTMIYYSYRQPPMYDNVLNEAVLNILQYAPLLFLSFGYWMFSNLQLFGDFTVPITKAGDVRQSGHYWYSVFTPDGYTNGPAFPLIVMFWVLFILLFFKKYIYIALVWISPSFFKVGELDLDEDIDNYYNCLDAHDRKWSIKEEENCRKVLGMKIITDDALEKLKTTK